MKKIITILGPTASGKTSLAIKLAKEFGGEIICADSRTIYKGMDIGTAKPTKAEQAEVPHHLIDMINPGEKFSVARFKTLAETAIVDIQSRNKLPFLVGGSGLYIDAVLYDYQFRESMNESTTKYDHISLEELQKAVKTKFPDAQINNSDFNNRRRLEQFLVLGMPKVVDRAKHKIDSLVLGIDVKIPVLKQNIAQRTNLMLSNNFIQEVVELKQKYGADCEQLTTTGYKSALKYLSDEITKPELEDDINRDTYQLARKQNTWFRRNQNIIWISDSRQATKLVSDYLGL